MDYTCRGDPVMDALIKAQLAVGEAMAEHARSREPPTPPNARQAPVSPATRCALTGDGTAVCVTARPHDDDEPTRWNAVPVGPMSSAAAAASARRRAAI